MGIGFEVGIVFALVLANGVFALSEIAVVTARKARLQQLSDEGDVAAYRALQLANAPGRFLSTVQVGITLVGVLAGAFGGATIARSLAPVIEPLPILGGGTANAAAFILVVVMITFLTLILGELVPKRIALNAPERLAAVISGPMMAVSRVAAPVIWVLETSTNLVLRMLRVRASAEPPVTEAEINVLLEQGTQAGIFVEAERDLIERVFDLGDLRAVNLMTPRPEVTWLDINHSLTDARRTAMGSLRSIFPAADGGLDNVRGLVRAKHLLMPTTDERVTTLTDLLRPAMFVPESLPALRLLEMFKRANDPMLIVVDEYGGTQGIVTLHDVLEAIVGDLDLPDEPDDPTAVQREDGSWLLDGMLAIEEFQELFQIPALPDDENGEYQTLAGFVMARTGSIPSAAETFEWNELRFEVVDMDGNRIDKVLVTPPDSPPIQS